MKTAVMRLDRRNMVIGMATMTGMAMLARPAHAASRADLDSKGAAALKTLYNDEPGTKALAEKAVGILVFPSIVKAGFVVGAQTGNGVLFKNGTAAGYYNLSSASFGLQAGAQAFSYALFFMNTAALTYLNKSDGWSVGTGPSVVALDKAAAASITSTTLAKDVYAVPFSQTGLMADLSLEGAKITQIHPGA